MMYKLVEVFNNVYVRRDLIKYIKLKKLPNKSYQVVVKLIDTGSGRTTFTGNEHKFKKEAEKELNDLIKYLNNKDK